MPLDWREAEVSLGTVFREMNEWTHDESHRLRRPVDAYLCECGDPSCTEPILMSWREYEDVRAYPTRFAIAVDHENPEIDFVVHEEPGFTVVESYGPPSRIARATDPRRSHAEESP